MNIIAILAALGLEQWRAFHWRVAMEGLFIRYARGVERKLNDGTPQHGLVATLATVAPPAVLAAVVFFALDAAHPLLGLVWNVAALYLLVGFRRFSHSYTAVEKALKAILVERNLPLRRTHSIRDLNRDLRMDGLKTGLAEKAGET